MDDPTSVAPLELSFASILASCAMIQTELAKPRAERDYTELGELALDIAYDLEMFEKALDHERKGATV